MTSPIRKVLTAHPGTTLSVLWVSLIGMVCYLAFTTIGTFRDANELVRERATAYAHLIAAHDKFYFDRAQGLLMEIEDHLTFEDMNTDVSPKRREEIEKLLHTHRDRLNGIASFTIIGADGIRRYGVVGKNFTDLNDRGYFKALKSGQSNTFVSPNEDGRASGKNGIHVARRINFGDKFGGVIVINLAIAEVFEPFYSSLALGSSSSITLRSKTKLLSRYPAASATFGQEIPDTSPITRLIKSGLEHGYAISDSPIDGLRRSASFEQLEGTEIYAVVGLSYDEAMAGPYNEIISDIIAALVAILAGILATIGIRKLVQSRDSIQAIAHRDVLTGLSNRQYLVDNFPRVLEETSKANGYLGMIFIDLDNFKLVNDTLGHSNGDQLLAAVAVRFRAAVDEGDEVIRIGGDEFIVLHRMAEGDPKDSTEKTCWKLLQALQEPFEIAGESIATGASLGASIYPFHGMTMDELSRKADLAMYRGKAFGKGVYTIYYPGLEDAHAKENLSTHSELVGAIERKEFALFFGPSINLVTGQTIGVEVLLRWKKEDGNYVSANKFIDVAEQNGLIIPIGKWVIEETCRIAAAWLAKGMPEIVFSVNISAVQINQSDIEKIIVQAINESRIPARMIQLEITESVMLADNEVVQGRIERLHNMGIKFAVDDFGTGYSSLAYLHRYAVDTIKIDSSFGDLAASDPSKRPLLAAIIGMGKAMNLTTVAEGVERGESLLLLQSLGCDEAQGYIFSRPLSLEGLVEFVREFEYSPPVARPVVAIA